MGQDPNQPYSGPYGQPPQQPPQGGYPPQGAYPPQGGYQQQQSGYQQGAYPPPPNPGYQQPYGAAPGQAYNTAHPNGATSMNMDPNVAAGVSYILGWITGLIFFLSEKQNRFVRFHAMQSIIFSIVWIVVYTAFTVIFGFLSILSIISCFISPLIGLAGFVLWVILLINAFQGKYFKLPVIGDMAERWANSGTPGM